jgi:hypothetical protein
VAALRGLDAQADHLVDCLHDRLVGKLDVRSAEDTASIAETHHLGVGKLESAVSHRNA